MMFVSSSGDPRRHYHFDPDCFRLRGGMARRRLNQVVTIDADVAKSMRLPPCKECFGDVLPNFFRPYCHLCGTWRACPHNGGIAVQTDNGTHWVWPDRVTVHRPLRNARSAV